MLSARTDERYAVVNEEGGDRFLTKKEYDEYVAPAEEAVVEEVASEMKAVRETPNCNHLKRKLHQLLLKVQKQYCHKLKSMYAEQRKAERENNAKNETWV
jgi:hypothetical protein